MDDFEAPDPHDTSRIIRITEEEQEEIRRIIGPLRPLPPALLKKWAEEEEWIKNRAAERLKGKQDDEKAFDRRRSKFQINFEAELAEWKRFQKLPAAEKEAIFEEQADNIQHYMMTKEKFLEDLQKRMRACLEQSDDDEEESEEDSEESEDSEDVSDEEEIEEEFEDGEEPEAEDWREAWFEMTGERWIECADQIWGPPTNPIHQKMSICEAVERQMQFLPKNEHREQKLQNSNLFDTIIEAKLDEKLPNRRDSDSDGHESESSGDTSSECSDRASDWNAFFASRPPTPINRETPEKLVEDVDSIELSSFPTPRTLRSSTKVAEPKMIELRASESRKRGLESRIEEKQLPRRPGRPRKQQSVPEPSKSISATPNSRKSTRITQKRAKSEVPKPKRAKSTVEKRVMPERAARQHDTRHFQAGNSKMFSDRKSKTVKNANKADTRTTATFKPFSDDGDEKRHR